MGYEKGFNPRLLAAPNNFHKIGFSLKWQPGGLRITDGDWKGMYTQVFGRSEELLRNRFIDRSTPSMRNMELPAKYKMAARGPKNG